MISYRAAEAKGFKDQMKDTHLYREYGPMFAHPQSALEARHLS